MAHRRFVADDQAAGLMRVTSTAARIKSVTVFVPRGPCSSLLRNSVPQATAHSLASSPAAVLIMCLYLCEEQELTPFWVATRT